MGMRSKPTVQKPMDMYYTPFFVKKGSASKAIEISQKSPETVHFYLAIPYALPGRAAQPRLFGFQKGSASKAIEISPKKVLKLYIFIQPFRMLYRAVLPNLYFFYRFSEHLF